MSNTQLVKQDLQSNYRVWRAKAPIVHPLIVNSIAVVAAAAMWKSRRTEYRTRTTVVILKFVQRALGLVVWTSIGSVGSALAHNWCYSTVSQGSKRF